MTDATHAPRVGGARFKLISRPRTTLQTCIPAAANDGEADFPGATPRLAGVHHSAPSDEAEVPRREETADVPHETDTSSRVAYCTSVYVQ